MQVKPLRIKPFCTLALTLAALLLSSGTASASPGSPQSDAVRVRLEPAGIQWEALGNNRSGVLTIAGPYGSLERREVAPGSTPAFSLYDDKGFPRPDGFYKWELVVAPGSPGSPLAGQVLSGSFQILNGAFVQPGEPERSGSPVRRGGLQSSVAKDQAVGDDLIVFGSLCVGLDCSNGESFGTDNLRLKATVLRMKFDDTSSGGGFPANDWQLTANDSGSGGLNKFSIEDITGTKVPFTLEAGAPNNSLYVSPSGKIGFGTSVPAANLHVAAGNTPSLRLEQNVSGGLPARTWDVTGSDTAFAVKDVTGATTPLQISTNGNVGLGVASPTSRLHLPGGVITIGGHSLGERPGGGQLTTDFQVNALRNIIWMLDSDNNSTNASFAVFTDNVFTNPVFVAFENNQVGINITPPSFPLHVGTNSTNGNGAHVTTAGVWTNGSSRFSKENIRALETDEAVATLAGLEPVRYTGKASPDGEEYLGFIAEDVPDLVAMNDRKSLSPMDIVAVLTKVLQTQQGEVQRQRQTIEKQQELIRQLEERLARLEAKQ